MIREDEVREKQEQKYGENPFTVTSTEEPEEGQEQTKINVDVEALLDTAVKSAAGGITTALLTKKLLEK